MHAGTGMQRHGLSDLQSSSKCWVCYEKWDGRLLYQRLKSENILLNRLVCVTVELS